MRSSTRRPAGLWLSTLAAVALLSLTACGSNQAAESRTGSPDSSATAREETPESRTGSSPGSSATGESESNTVTVPGSDITFAVPKGWVSLRISEAMDNAKNAGTLKDMASRMGVAPEQLRQRFAEQFDLLVVTPEPVDGFVSTMGVDFQENASVPSIPRLKSQMQSGGAEVTGSREVSTPVGDATVLTYTVSGRYGTFTVLNLDGAAIITVVSQTSHRATARAATQQLLDTVASDG